MTESAKIKWMDNLRVIATISVIFLHVSASILYRYGSVSDFTWWVGNVFDGTVRYCVPVFVMLSGALLLGKDMPVWEFYKKRFLRVLLPFLFFAVLYTVFYWFFKMNDTQQSMQQKDILGWLGNLVSEGISFHFWFIYMILLLYIMMPFLSRWVRGFSEKNYLQFFAIWLLLILINVPFSFVAGNNNVYYRYFLSKLGYIGYLVLGYYLSQKVLIKSKALKIGILLFILGVLLTVFLTYFDSAKRDRFVGFFYEYLTLNVLFASVGILLVIKNVSQENKALILIRDFINRYSFGIYLVHVMVLDVFYLLGFYWDRVLYHPVFSIPVITISCLIVSSIIIYLIHKIPIVGKYISG